MNAKKIRKLEEKFAKKGSRKINEKEKLLKKVKKEFAEWLKLADISWWEK